MTAAVPPRSGHLTSGSAPLRPRAAAVYRSALRSALRRHPSGDTLPDVELERAGAGVDRAHLAVYNRVCGFRLSDVLPSTYPHVLAFPLAVALMTRADFPLPLVGLVHIANRIEQRRPLHAGVTLDLRVRPEHLRPHDKGQFDVVAEARVGAELVWLGRSTYLHRDQPAQRSQPTVHSGQPPVATAVWRVPARIGKDYARVSGDRNPIHTSRLGARIFGFPRPIAHGMWSKARSLAALEGRLPDAYTVEVAFKTPILLPATVAFSAARDGGGDGGWRLALHDAKSGRPHLAGNVSG
jgi:acyl dehydratase